jgi:H+/Cl- antiporter ClcA
MRESIAAFRKHLALPKTSWQICLLAIIGGSAAALLVVLFTLTIEQIQQLYLIKRDNYNSLDEVSRFDLPIIGAIIILFIAWLTGYKYIRTGIPFVLHRLKVAHGIIPLKNTFNQFWGSAVALASGFSVGREGPAVHLGAACSSYIGERLKLPYNSIRTLCACGIAAGISATFNTPIAAVIFVMEVILREYKIHVFIPIMLAAIVGSLITQNFFGQSHGFQSFNAITIDHQHYLALVVLAIFLGILAAAFNKYLVLIIKHSITVHIIPRLMLAAIITGSLGYLVPSAMGTGVSAIDISLANHWQVGLLLSVLVAKILMTIFALGLGIPGGIIGPIIGIGAIAGAFTSALLTQFIPGSYLDSGLGNDFILMGMAGFMAASLNAPLAALLAVVELSGQLEIIVPAMVTITIASITSRQLCKNRSIFSMQLDMQQLIYQKPPIEESLQKIGVLAIMKDNFTLITKANTTLLDSSLAQKYKHTLIINKVPSHNNKQQISYIWIEPNIVNLAHKITSEHSPSAEKLTIPPIDTVEDLLSSNTQDISLTSHSDNNNTIEKAYVEHKLLPLSHQATLAEAYLQLVEKRCGAVYIYHNHIEEILGIVTFEQLRSYLVEGKLN